eukprot:TRINITY_DN15975_c2_g1_i1.p1 TRINITY_DN15975_c2_g1~~TRINITY_DN15975_c2_g1_i1.p1  ORF type:complete len:1262 (+),score=287.34 TRINITY_DN15975_c2_g1_i1:128-3913(+)
MGKGGGYKGRGGGGKGREGGGFEGREGAQQWEGEERDRGGKGSRKGGKGKKGGKKNSGGEQAARSDRDGDWRGAGNSTGQAHADGRDDRRGADDREDAGSGSDDVRNGNHEDVRNGCHDISNGSQDVRYASQDVRYGGQDVRYASQDVRYGGQDTRYASQDVRYGAQDVRYSTQDARYASQDVRYDSSQPQDSSQTAKKSRNRGGRNRKKPGDGGGTNGTATKAADGGTRQGKEATSADPAEDWEAEDDVEEEDCPETAESKVDAKKNPALCTKIRKALQLYEETVRIEELGNAYALVEESHQSGEGICDAPTLTVLLEALARVNKLANAHKAIDMAVAEQVFLDPAAVITITLAVSQRTQSHKALRFLRRLIYDCMPPDFTQEMTNFFDRHVSFIFSELMAEADTCFGRMENRDSNALVSLGHAELDIQMDWDKSTGTNFVLFNRADETGSKKVYKPTILGSSAGFQRTDSALMSFDISYPEVQKQVPRDYDRIRDGAEVEVISSATGPDKVAPLGVRLTSAPKEPLRPQMFYRLDRLASKDQSRRMLAALKVILRKPPESKKEEKANPVSSLQPSPILRDLILTPIDTTLAKAGKADLATTVMDFAGNKVRQKGLANFMEESKHAYNHLLNQSQLKALTLATSLRLTLIQGPPGTGKTTTAVQIVTALVQYGLVDLPMLVTADSNTAVDNLVKGLGKRGLQVVRVGRPESIREDVKGYSLDGRWKDLKKAEVVCATCIGASGSTLDKARFSTVLIDECTQAAESAALVPLARGCQQAILIGDQCQLPPTVLSDVAETENLGESLFTRLVTQGVRPVLLDTQYRMHPLIAEFASAAFYNGRLQNGVSHIHRKPPEGFPWPQRHMPVAFVNLERGEEKREGSSYINPAEAEKTLWSLMEVCKNDQLGPEEVGIVTPYKGQVNFIKKLIRERPGLAKFRSGLEVESVDGFQGQEKEVIIFCAVRNNREGKVGFLSDWRRLNVMLTRARRGCIVIGSRSTLVSDPLWHEWLLWATARGAICGESAKGTWQAKYLVDDRDGVWTIKSNVADQPVIATGPSAAAAGQAAPQEPEEILDSWEDMGSPLTSPAMKPGSSGGPGSPLAELRLDPAAAEEAAAPSPAPAPAAPALPAAASASSAEAKTSSAAESGLSRAQELRAERLRQEAEAQESMAQLQISSLGLDQVQAADRAAGSRPAAQAPPSSPPQRTKPSSLGGPVGHEDDVMRSLGSPGLGPRSPQRQLAMAKLGLLEDAEAEELSTGPKG